jgi:DNA-binding CsgD family transcriptional regulator
MSLETLLAKLSPAERRVLDILLTGAQNKVIARALGLAEGTVKVHVKSLLKKLDAKSRVEAVVKVLPRAPCTCDVEGRVREAAAMNIEFAGPLVLRTFGAATSADGLDAGHPRLKETLGRALAPVRGVGAA